MKLLDKIYFALKNITNPASFDEAYDDGFRAGVEVTRARILAELSDKSLHGFSDPSLALGYAHAVAVVKGEI